MCGLQRLVQLAVSGPRLCKRACKLSCALCVRRRTDYLLFWFWVDVLACLPVQCMLTSWAPDIVWWNLGYTNRCACCASLDCKL